MAKFTWYPLGGRCEQHAPCSLGVDHPVCPRCTGDGEVYAGDGRYPGLCSDCGGTGRLREAA